MTEITFLPMRDLVYRAELVMMMESLYSEDSGPTVVGRPRFPANVEASIDLPARGSILLFMQGERVRGYALLVPYWSNELGGTLLFVDELFVVAAERGRGIGTRFMAFLERERPFNAVALALEVSPRTRERAGSTSRSASRSGAARC